ncbi:hypothetical protein [Acinetobacter tianfuensis]|uniref:Lipoprotein n=1 Tax=Acinetobacter tianfuensis TaxID=2419603 RepID=A0A3A8E694_9GAMM|nr:hypothetical protein [Acinetobacter tianfuensis]RKG29699.1 hypothetical protein D7V32_13865 [Acinetobacter tianfuensis]
MKKLLALSVLVALAGCAEKKPLTPEEQWQGYCRSVGNAARTVMLDRQNAIEKDKAVEHANKIEDETTKKFLLTIVDEVYALPESAVKEDVEASREKIRAEFTAKCIATPHDKMPEYKPF